ncbi:MAG TPA: SpoIIE family protein phosphatase, partial [Candidatus Nitrosotalea sp.]|nr:SpoIIE family protein phosphatase [Candidatus Nitrosotalea sp.]
VALIIGRQLTIALENIKTFEREQRLTERLRFVARVTEKLFATLDSQEMLALLLNELLGDFADYGVAATLADDALKIVASAGTKAGFRDAAQGEIIASLRERRSIINGSISNVGPGRRIKGGPLAESDTPISWVMVPLFVGDTIYGTILCCSNSHRYDPAELELLEEIGRRASLALEHAESFARERRLIQTLQQATLPTRLATVEGAALSAVYRAAAIEVQVGGDWYDAFDLDENRVLLTVGDVTGHGLEASIVMGKLRHAINVAAMYEPDPVRILDAAERILLRRYPGSVATAFVAIFDARDRSLTYANAGHPYPIVRAADGSLPELQADGLPIGLRSAAPSFSSARSVSLHDAALVAFYTDGLTEATRNIAAGERRLKEALATEAVFYVTNAAEFIESFTLTEPSPDDVAILTLNFVKAQRWRFDSDDWSQARAARRELLEHLEARARSGSDVKAAELILGELIANVAQHAGGRLDVSLEWRAGNAVLHVVDRGAGFAPASTGEADLLTEYGRGLWLIQRLGAQLRVERLPGFGTHVEAKLPIEHV